MLTGFVEDLDDVLLGRGDDDIPVGENRHPDGAGDLLDDELHPRVDEGQT